MATGTTQQTLDRITLNPYGIVIRTLHLNDEGIKNEVVAFGKDLVSFVDGYEKRRLPLANDPGLSPEGRTTALAKLRQEYVGPINVFLTRAESMYEILRTRFLAMIPARIKYRSDSSPVIEMLRQTEVRTNLGSKGSGELVSLFMAAATSDLIFYSLLNAPMAMLSNEHLETGCQEKIRRTDPNILAYRNDVIEAMTTVMGALGRAYSYLGLRLDRQLTVDLPSYRSILMQISHPGDSMKA